MTIRKTRITQLELEGFAALLEDKEEGQGLQPLSMQEIRERSLAAKQALEAKFENMDIIFPDWSEPYHRLINAGWPWRIAAYVAWASMPKGRRWPNTQDELAIEVLGLTSDRQIAEWRKKYPSIDQLIADLQAEAMLEYRPGAIHALGTVASDPSYRANPDRRLLFEMTGDHVPRLRTDVTQGVGIGKDVLDRLDKVPTDKLVEMLGDDALSILQKLREEVVEDSTITPDLIPSPSPEGEGSQKGEE